uniref:Protein kinase domain-containing protein n=1 Tax=Acrobeloides nanus TaxID=290746 RepID=A0A914EJ81_9BILA
MATHGTLQLFLVFGLNSVDSATYYVYESTNLTNYIYSTGSTIITNFTWLTTKSFTIFSNGNMDGTTQWVARIVEDHAANCYDPMSSILGYPYFLQTNQTIRATSTGSCTCTIVVPVQLTDRGYHSILGIINVDYKGDSNVRAIMGYQNNDSELELFEFTEQTATRWNNIIVYDNLVSFIIPRNGTLKVSYQSASYTPKPSLVFQEHGSGIFMSLNYPHDDALLFEHDIELSLTCTIGYASYNVTIIYADIPSNTSLQVSNGNIILDEYDQNVTFLSKVYYTDQYLSIQFVDSLPPGDVRSWDGFLIRYEAVHMEKPTKNYIWLIILCSVIVFILMIAAIVYLIYRMKHREKYFEQLYDTLKDMHLSKDDIEALRTKSDEFLIDERLLHIYFNNPLGQGSTSSVYKGHLEGTSPLHNVMKSMGTQCFMDCDVAVKVPGNFGQNEVQNLFQEIKAIKKIEYHNNVVSFLVTYLGMQYISSKGLIHRDLAARNILLCDNNVAKISDFGLCVTSSDNNSPYEASLHKKLPMKWLPLETLNSRIISEKSDVWSFGILSYEMYSLGKVPYENMDINDVHEFLTNGNRLECPQYANEEIYNMMVSCWHENPDDRPTFTRLLEILRSLLEDTSDEYEYFC